MLSLEHHELADTDRIDRVQRKSTDHAAVIEYLTDRSLATRSMQGMLATEATAWGYLQYAFQNDLPGPMQEAARVSAVSAALILGVMRILEEIHTRHVAQLRKFVPKRLRIIFQDIRSCPSMTRSVASLEKRFFPNDAKEEIGG